MPFTNSGWFDAQLYAVVRVGRKIKLKKSVGKMGIVPLLWGLVLFFLFLFLVFIFCKEWQFILQGISLCK